MEPEQIQKRMDLLFGKCIRRNEDQGSTVKKQDHQLILTPPLSNHLSNSLLSRKPHVGFEQKRRTYVLPKPMHMVPFCTLTSIYLLEICSSLLPCWLVYLGLSMFVEACIFS